MLPVGQQFGIGEAEYDLEFVIVGRRGEYAGAEITLEVGGQLCQSIKSWYCSRGTRRATIRVTGEADIVYLLKTLPWLG